MFAIRSGSVPALDSWGTVSDLGSEILEGTGEAFGAMVSGAPDSTVSCGYFGTVKGKFRMTYPFNEHAVVVEGSVTLTDESTGETRHYGPGDAWFVAMGTTVLWEIHTDRFVKNYMAATGPYPAHPADRTEPFGL